jgi:hypothetical protein
MLDLIVDAFHGTTAHAPSHPLSGLLTGRRRGRRILRILGQGVAGSETKAKQPCQKRGGEP